MKRRKQGRPRGYVFANGQWAWGQWRVNGQRVRKNLNIPLSDPDWQKQAREALDKELAKVTLGQGKVVGSRLGFGDLAELVRLDYVRRGRRSLDRAEYALGRLDEVFGGKKVGEINEAALDAYVDARLQRVKTGTVKIEMSILKRSFRLAVAKKLLSSTDVPNVPVLAAGAAREGFLEDDAFLKVVGFLPEYLKGIAWMAFLCGMRRAEILSLTWANVDRAAKVIRLNKTKSGKRRLLAYGQLPELVQVIERQHEARMDLGRESGALCPWVFHHRGKVIIDFRHCWKEATRQAGAPATLFHDLRRCAIRRLVRNGVPDVIAQRISGHASRSVFDRYNIVSETDIENALGRVSLGHSSAIKSAERKA